MTAQIPHLRPCGTDAAWHRHYRRREPIDDACAQAHRDAAKRQMQTVRARSETCGDCLACGRPRKAGRGAHGRCHACDARWRAAGMPEGGPPPKVRDLANRYEDFCWVREGFETVEVAGRRVGVLLRQAMRYETRRREQVAA